MKNLKLLQLTTWKKIFQTWKKQEGSNPDWQNVAIQNGWNSWDEWRSNSVSMFDAQNREWHEYEIEQPLDTIPDIFVGPYKSWQKHFDKSLVKTFKNLAEEKTEWVQTELKNYRIDVFPAKSILIGVFIEELDRMYLIEGHHRASYIALSKLEGKDVQFTQNPTIAVTTMKQSEMALLEQMLEVGTRNQNQP